MKQDIQELLRQINSAVIRYRGVYSAWARKHGIGYSELLVLYTIRDNGFCTQKQICQNYLLPKQTINHTIGKMLTCGLLRESAEEKPGREKRFVFTEAGLAWASPLLASLGRMEDEAVGAVGAEKIVQMTSLVSAYDEALTRALREEEELLWNN